MHLEPLLALEVTETLLSWKRYHSNSGKSDYMHTSPFLPNQGENEPKNEEIFHSFFKLISINLCCSKYGKRFPYSSVESTQHL